MIAVDLGRAAVIATIPLLSYLDALSVGWIYAAAFATATLTIAFDSGQFAALPNLVSGDDLVTANGRLQASYSAAMVVGPLLAGVLVAVVDLETVFLVDSASFVASAVSLGLVRTSFNPDEPPERKHILRDVSEGLRYVLGHPVLRNISLMMALINFVLATTFTQLVLFASVELDASDTQIAVLFASGAAGVVCLGLAAGPLRRRLSFSVATLGALMLEGVLCVVFAFNNVYALGLVVWAAMSGLGLFFNINTTSLRQQIVPSHLLGRVVSIAGVMAWSAIPLGALLGGWAIEATDDVALVYAVIGALTFVIALAFRFSALGHADDYLGAPDDAPTEAGPLPDPAVATRGGG
jgi:Major Facilitator Superfamily